MKELYESTYDFSTSSGRKAREVIISIVTKVWVCCTTTTLKTNSIRNSNPAHLMRIFFQSSKLKKLTKTTLIAFFFKYSANNFSFDFKFSHHFLLYHFIDYNSVLVLV
ncbi:hypothetical protein DERP_010414, partial [Dermatophagoides pteronyssinus]